MDVMTEGTNKKRIGNDIRDLYYITDIGVKL